jgi:hypothetical protein
MSNITSNISNAFLRGEAKRISNSYTDGKSLYLFDNKIAEHRDDGMYITNCGWESKTTKERLNGLPDVRINQFKKKWYLNGEVWDGEWIKVNDNPPPEVDEEKIGSKFITTKKWVQSDGWRGYEEPIYSVCGVNDTGMWDDSPCKSDVGARELAEVITILKKNKIPTRKVVCQSSNLFCIKRYVIVPPKYIDVARELAEVYYNEVDTTLLYLSN